MKEENVVYCFSEWWWKYFSRKRNIYEWSTLAKIDFEKVLPPIIQQKLKNLNLHAWQYMKNYILPLYFYLPQSLCIILLKYQSIWLLLSCSNVTIFLLVNDVFIYAETMFFSKHLFDITPFCLIKLAFFLVYVQLQFWSNQELYFVTFTKSKNSVNFKETHSFYC